VIVIYIPELRPIEALGIPSELPLTEVIVVLSRLRYNNSIEVVKNTPL
jgi:hypothetical protein